jgi:hypothetical protein
VAEGAGEGGPSQCNEARASDIVAAPGIVQNGAPTEPKSSGTAAAVALFRDALAQEPLDLKIIEPRAVEAGLLEENTPISKSKVFRSARALKSGQRAAGWVWSLPDKPTSEAQVWPGVFLGTFSSVKRPLAPRTRPLWLTCRGQGEFRARRAPSGPVCALELLLEEP